MGHEAGLRTYIEAKQRRFQSGILQYGRYCTVFGGDIPRSQAVLTSTRQDVQLAHTQVHQKEETRITKQKS
jgi:hypothetical protein